MKEGDKVLDVGCANGYSAIHHLDKNISSITGVDFTWATDAGTIDAADRLKVVYFEQNRESLDPSVTLRRV